MLILSLAISLSTSSFLARAQASTSAICLAEFDWMKNSKGQTPCLITAWLSVPCQPEGFNVEGPLQNFTFYRGPDPTKDLLECQCNTVLYSTYAACAWCQGHTDNLGIANWTMFSQYCEDRKFSSYPQSLISPDTAIPAWAYAPLMGAPGRWDEKAALAIVQQSLPESTYSATQTSTSVASSGSSSLAPSQSSQSASETPTADLLPSDSGPPKRRDVVGPAVGGTIGGIAVILLLGTGVWLYDRRRCRRFLKKPGTVVASSDNHESGGPHALPETVILYNPDDPSTYPSAELRNRGIPGATGSSMDTSDREAVSGTYMRRAEIQ